LIATKAPTENPTPFRKSRKVLSLSTRLRGQQRIYVRSEISYGESESLGVAICGIDHDVKQAREARFQILSSELHVAVGSREPCPHQASVT